MRTVFVKICGITRSEDAEMAADLGADAIGFIFWPGSPRYVDPAAARAIAERASSAVLRVGVFVNETAEHVANIMEVAGLDMAQLHGAESPDYCRTLARICAGNGPERGLIKAIGLQACAPVALGGFDPEVVILIDAHDPLSHGGTGRTVNWDAAGQLAASRRTILAGGLTPENVALAVETVRPFGVDVSSGVESRPGVKDAARLKSFFEALDE